MGLSTDSVFLNTVSHIQLTTKELGRFALEHRLSESRNMHVSIAHVNDIYFNV